jgi:uncharacterized OB-fold protein
VDVDAPPIHDGLFAVEGDRLTLLGGWSDTSGQYHFPRGEVCPYSGADDVTAVELPRRGSLCWWTTVRTAPPGYAGPVPYRLGVVQLECRPLLRVVGRLGPPDADEDLRPGTPMVVGPEVIDTPDGARTTWAFTTVAGT